METHICTRRPLGGYTLTFPNINRYSTTTSLTPTLKPRLNPQLCVPWSKRRNRSFSTHMRKTCTHAFHAERTVSDFLSLSQTLSSRHAYIMYIYTNTRIFHWLVYTSPPHPHTTTRALARAPSEFIWKYDLSSCQVETMPGFLLQCSRFKHIYFSVGGWQKKVIRIKTKWTWALAELLQNWYDNRSVTAAALGLTHQSQKHICHIFIRRKCIWWGRSRELDKSSKQFWLLSLMLSHLTR